MQTALNDLWEYTGELFTPSATEQSISTAGIGADLTKIEPLWRAKVEEVIEQATLTLPTGNYAQKGGKIGYHSEHLGYILAEMQYLQRAYPGAEW
jgi:ring-1,2-phenylacetyl-CoA epoxidase subunit PaaC